MRPRVPPPTIDPASLVGAPDGGAATGRLHCVACGRLVTTIGQSALRVSERGAETLIGRWVVVDEPLDARAELRAWGARAGRRPEVAIREAERAGGAVDHHAPTGWPPMGQSTSDSGHQISHRRVKPSRMPDTLALNKDHVSACVACDFTADACAVRVDRHRHDRGCVHVVRTPFPRLSPASHSKGSVGQHPRHH
jgi:hypothetical protein